VPDRYQVEGKPPVTLKPDHFAPRPRTGCGFRATVRRRRAVLATASAAASAIVTKQRLARARREEDPLDDAKEMIEAGRAQRAMFVLRLALGAMFVWVFFENLGKGAYTPAGYKGVIDHYLMTGHAPAVWKAVMSVMAANARIVAPLQAATELGFGVLLLAGAATRVVAAAAGAFLFSLWVSELGTSWIWELAMPVVVAFSLAWARAGRTWGVDALLARRFPDSRLG
jgi:uncharacterized membrane protein YphA (DoxX/SURF4 family)